MSLGLYDFERLGRMLGDDFGIKVVVGGNTMASDGKTIYLPNLPDTADERILTKVRAYLDHEASHIAAKTDFGLAKKFQAKWGEVGYQVLNALEDVRSESILAEHYAGCGQNIGQAALMVYEDAGAKIKGGDTARLDRIRQLADLTYCVGRGYPVPAWIEDGVKQIARQYAVGIQDVRDYAKQTGDLEPLAEQLCRAFNLMEQNNPPEEQSPPQKQQGPGDGNSNGSGNTGGNGAGGGGGGAGGTGKADAQQTQAPAPSGGIGQDLAADVTAALQQMSTEDPYSLIRPCNENLDVVVDIKTTHTMANTDVTDFAQRIQRAGGPIRNRLAMLLKSEAKVGWRRRQQAGSVDARNLHHLANGTTLDVMRKKIVTPATDTACYLLIDGSGSMGGGKEVVASEAAAVFASVLDSSGHAAEVATFVNGGNSASQEERERFHKSFGLMRLQGVALKVSKRFDEPYRRCIPKLYAGRLATGGTPLAEAIEMATKRLAGRSEKRRVLMAFTDGVACMAYQMSDAEYTRDASGDVTGYRDPKVFEACNNITAIMKAVIAKAERQGIQVVLIGIGCDIVRQYHTRVAVCNNIADLPKATMDELSKALKV